MSGSRLVLLGGFRLYRHDGTAVPLAARKAQALLSYLALQRERRCARDRLAALLWEGSTSAHARQSLRQVLAELRRALPHDEPVLDTTGDGIRVIPEALTVDVHDFERLADEDTPEALAGAVELYQGELLEGFDPRAPAFDDWLMAERSRLHERALGALQQLLEHELASDATARAIRRALHLLSLDPLRESAHRRLMELYARQGHYGAALKQYRVCQHTLRRELNVAPEDATERVFRHIMQQRQGVGADTAAAPGVDDDAVAAPGASGPRPATVLRARTALGGRGDTGPVLADTVRRHGGELVAQDDGGVLAVFGIPKAHSDDAERAVRAAVGMRDAVPGLRLGIASGPVTLGDDGAAGVSGEAVDRAVELAGAGTGGEIRLSARLYASVARHVEAERLGADAGIPWRLRTLRSERRAARPAFVGREREWRQCAAALEACREIASGQALLVRGEAGIGKSRLLEECAAEAARLGFACHEVLVLDAGMERDPVGALVRSLLGLAPDDAGQRAETAVDHALAEGLVEPAQRPELHDLLGLAQPPAQRSVFEALDEATRRERRQALVTALVAARARRRPQLLIVEDIHWADRFTLDHLARIAAAVADCPALLVMTHRLEGAPLDPAWRGAMHGAPLTTIDLGPLRDDAVRALAAELAGRADDFVRRCIERAEGNPWFLEQLLQTEVIADAAIPDSLRSLVWARLDGLPAADREAAGAAAVLGQRLDAAALRHLLDDPEYDATTLVEQHLLQPEGDDFRFSHDLVREGIHDALPASQRRRLHARAAGWFRDRDPVRAAQHLDHAGSPEAASAYGEAARAQARAHRPEQALALLARGLELARDTAERHALLRLQADLLHETGAVDRAIAAYRQAAALAEDDEQRCQCWLGVAAGHGVRDRHEDALAALDEAERLAGHRARPLARLHTLRGNLLFPLGRIDECLKAHQRARKYAREAGSPELEARALSGLGDAAYLRGQMVTACGHFDRCVELAREHRLAWIEAANLHMYGVTRFYANELEQARRATAEGAELAARVAHARAETVARTALVTVLCYQGDWPAAERQVEQGLDLARRLGAGRFEAEYLLWQALVRLGRNQRAAAERSLDQAYALSREASLAYVGPWILGALAAATGDPGKRRRALAEGETLLAAGSVSHNHLHFHQLAIDVALDDGDPDAARRQCAALDAYTHAEPLPWATFFAARGRALADRADGERGEAVRQRLRDLADEAEHAGLHTALPALRAALAAR